MSTPKFGADTVRKIADLARLDLSEQETQQFASQIESILTYIEKLQALDTSKVEPMVNYLEDFAGTKTRFANDEVVPGPGAEAMTATAPESIFENYKVPQVIGGGH